MVTVLTAACSKEHSENNTINDTSVDEIRIDASLTKSTKTSLVDSIIYRRIHLDGYTNSDGKTPSNNRHLDANALYENGWIFYTDIKNVHYYWPQNSRLDFFGYSPADLSKTCCTIERTSDYHNKVICTALPVSDTAKVARELEEFVCAEKKNCEKTAEPVRLEFKRPFCVIRFKLDQAVRSDLNFIRITDIHNSGSLDCSVTPWVWSVSGGFADFTCNVYKNYPSEINNESDLGGPFIMIPQDLRPDGDDPVYMEFNYQTIGNDKPTTTFVKLGTSSGSSGVVDRWEPDRCYTYYISLLGAAGEVKMSVTCEQWTKRGNSEIIVQ